ncbi:N-dimethylarginine dimethylaminohydrolase [Mycolicibacterium neoaurum]|uniref:N-dimethylarginine dimethylaminohydrolase n=2 Tax=Mycolicibacterium neoaurum TaxID=1795 RepID=A0AAV2WSJ4_MYCNE|nr:N-dimethylarginine dimethylaminohydrolase [Mycolicibacterium neoaurum]
MVMTVSDLTSAIDSTRRARTRRFVMTAPTHFAVHYAINPWMDPTIGVDVGRAVAQWEGLRRTYTELGHTVELVDPVPGLPDMVYAANGGLVVNGHAIVANFTYPERAAEADAYSAWMSAAGLQPRRTRHRNEGQGDLLVAGTMVLAGYGFRTDRRAHDEIAEITGLPVLSLELIDPRFYHLDTALTVLTDGPCPLIAYYPPAFSDGALALLRSHFPDALTVGTADAFVLGLNAVSDGRHVLLPAAATGFAAQLRDAGFRPIGIELSELLKGGGSVKCCTLEVFS